MHKQCPIKQPSTFPQCIIFVLLQTCMERVYAPSSVSPGVRSYTAPLQLGLPLMTLVSPPEPVATMHLAHAHAHTAHTARTHAHTHTRTRICIFMHMHTHRYYPSKTVDDLTGLCAVCVCYSMPPLSPHTCTGTWQRIAVPRQRVSLPVTHLGEPAAVERSNPCAHRAAQPC